MTEYRLKQIGAMLRKGTAYISERTAGTPGTPDLLQYWIVRLPGLLQPIRVQVAERPKWQYHYRRSLLRTWH